MEEMKNKIALFNEELPIIKEFAESIKAKLCYVAVNKKTDLKFFEKSGSRLENPKSGTCVDTDAVSPDFYEFYLQPQFVNQGTATPVHYHCLFDNTGIPIQVLEDITFKQTFYYWNWPGPIREPAALKFAEVCNSFSSRYLRNEIVRSGLLSTPYYI